MLSRYIPSTALLIAALLLLTRLLNSCKRKCRAALERDPVAVVSAKCLAICHRLRGFA